MIMIRGSLWVVRVSSWIPGRLELMHPVFQVIIFSVEVWWLSVSMLVFGLGLGCMVSCVG
jgi:hypothetical protein